jgi:hypothetical protein
VDQGRSNVRTGLSNRKAGIDDTGAKGGSLVHCCAGHYRASQVNHHAGLDFCKELGCILRQGGPMAHCAISRGSMPSGTMHFGASGEQLSGDVLAHKA